MRRPWASGLRLARAAIATAGQPYAGSRGARRRRLAQLAQLFEKLLLAGAQLGRQYHADLHVQVTVPALSELRHALAGEADALAVLRAGRNLERDASGHRRHGYLAAEQRVVKRHRRLFDQIVAVALEALVRLHRDLEIQVALGAAPRAGLPFARNAYARAGAHAGRDLHFDAARLAYAAGALADGADRVAGEAGAVAADAGLGDLDRECARGAGVGLFQRDLHLVFEILALACHGLAVAAAEDTAEDVAQAALGVHVGHAEAAIATAARRRRAEEVAGALRLALLLLDLVGVLPLVAVLVVLAALLGVEQHLLRGVDLLELRLGALVAGVHVRVVFAGEFAVRLPNLLLGGVSLHAEYVVVVLACHLRSPTVALRSGVRLPNTAHGGRFEPPAGAARCR